MSQFLRQSLNTSSKKGDQIRVLPCLHEYNMSCVDKWLKEIHGGKATQLQSSMYSRWLSNRNNQTKPSTMLASTKHYKPHGRFITVNQMKIVCIFLKDNVQEGDVEDGEG
ncbi:hypothetical protein PHAVU_010G062700 [Phaseolus vulgaris]|uniref:RING-type domain-containing protein n=1 Tax=Phaseolus vulgaris TaxID=3885 RepID=V7AMW6_PHAVU|nr:hypothetical protein PHAVU_010G062700g [Phaseolus vulgaris]ESW06620.1 hypothetical protein PHAVU_010G062700g [Phaseolus vulgaris]